jgi:hypothetical protein
MIAVAMMIGIMSLCIYELPMFIEWAISAAVVALLIFQFYIDIKVASLIFGKKEDKK